jgi:ABC-type branched-subunit amino acid transport system substrate-binding protein
MVAPRLRARARTKILAKEVEGKRITTNETDTREAQPRRPRCGGQKAETPSDAGSVSFKERATMLQKRLAIAALILGVAPVLFAQGARAEDPVGVAATEIRVGSTFPFSGPASAFGNVGKALLAYAKFINDKGGVNGRKIKLIALDDAYSWW